MKRFTLITLFIFSYLANAQGLLDQQIFKIPSEKKAIYLDAGIFHYSKGEEKASLIALRHSVPDNKAKDYERMVFDFDTESVPNIYGYMDRKSKKIFLDFYNTTTFQNLSSFGKSNYVKEVTVFPISSKSLPLEITFKDDVAFDIFFLKNKGRLVIDVRRN